MLTRPSTFKCIGMEFLVTVKKVRRNWMYRGCEISLDDVEGLGSFIEIEYKGSLSDPDGRPDAPRTLAEVHALFDSALKELGADIGGKIRGGYAQMILENEKYD